MKRHTLQIHVRRRPVTSVLTGAGCTAVMEMEDAAADTQAGPGGCDGTDDQNAEEAAGKKMKASCTDRKCVPGIIYLGHIPPRLRPKHLRNMLAAYGEIGRVFLQPEGKDTQTDPSRAGGRSLFILMCW